MKNALIATVFFITVLSVAGANHSSGDAQTAKITPSVLDSRALFMLSSLKTGQAPANLLQALSRPSAAMSVRFDHVLSDAELSDLVKKGLSVKIEGGQPVHIGTVYSMNVEWDSIALLPEINGIIRAEPAWNPLTARPLDISIPTVGADKAWDMKGPGKNSLDGNGVIIANIDSGVDYMHPAFFFADGEEYDWINVAGDGKFAPGVDAVDLNRNGKKIPVKR